MLNNPRGRFIFGAAAAYLLLAAAWVVLTDRLVANIGDPAAAARLAAIKGLFFIVVTTGLLLLALSRVPPAGAARPEWPTSAMHGIPWRLVAGAAVLIGVISVVGILAFRVGSDRLEQDKFEDLQALAQIKADGISRWIDERRSEARLFASSPLVADALMRWLDGGDEAARTRLEHRLESALQNTSVGRVALFDASGRLLLARGPVLADDAVLATDIVQHAHTDAAAFEDTNPDGDSRSIAIFGPVAVGTGADRRILATVSYEVALGGFLSRYVDAWPLPRELGSIALARVDAAGITFLSGGSGAAFSDRSTDTELHSPVAALLRAGQGATATVDRHGTPILAATAKVVGVPWVVLATVDRDTALGDIGTLAQNAAAVTLLSILAAAMAASFVWQRQRMAAMADAVTQARALDAAETRFRATFEQAAVGIAHLDPDGRFRRVNGRLAEMVDYAPSALLGKDVREIIHPDDLPAMESSFKGLLDGAVSVYRAERRYRRAAGSFIWVTVTVSLVRDAAGRPDYLIAVAEDISARKGAEMALRESKESFSALFRDNPTPILICRMNDRMIIEVNDAWMTTFGYAREEMLSHTASQLALWVDPEVRLALYRRLETDGSAEMEGQLRHQAGDVVDVQIRARLIEFAGQDCCMAIVTDVTSEKRAEEAAQRNYDQMRRFVDQAPIGIAMFDRDMNYLATSRRWLDTFGRGHADLIGQSHYAVHPDVPERWKDIHRQALDGETIRNDEDLWTRGDGTKFWLRWAVQPWRDAAGVIGGIIISAEDITAERQTEAALRSTESRLVSTLDAARIVAWEVDLASWTAHGVGPFTEVYGVPESAGDTLLNDFMDHVHPEDRQDIQREIEAAIAARTHFEKEFRFIDPDGKTRWLAMSGDLVPGDGELERPRLLGITYDITRRKEDEDELRRAATVFASTHEGVVVTDRKGSILTVNPAFCAITGYAEEDVVGRNMRMLQSGRHDRAFYQMMWEAIATLGYWQGEIWNRRKEGEAYPEWLTISAMRDAVGHLTGYVGVFTDIARLKESESKLEHMAHYDPLTDLPNRVLLLSRLTSALARSRRSGRKGAVLFADLDRFKLVNDSLGHPAGDALLQAVARRLQGRLRETDTLARLHGDEFVVLLEDLSAPEEAARIAEDLIELCREPFPLPQGAEVYASFSVGIAMFPDDGVSNMELIQRADAALYDAKTSGRHTYRFFTSSLTAAAALRLETEARMRRGIEQNEFVVFYQPQVELNDRRINGVEALIRWQDPTVGLVPPDRFIPVAEETGLIVALGEFVLRAACMQMKTWLDGGLPIQTMAVNLSPKQFRQDDLVERVRAILAESALPATHLELEITEGTLMDSRDQGVEKLLALRAMGVKLSIDDFGTGYSSLAYLKTFPVDKLKVDQRFVRGIADDMTDAEITAAIIGLGKILKIEVLAEGVETEVQLDFLRQNGCHSAQGFLFSRPVPADRVTVLLAEAPPDESPASA
jgi:diguanylate cyclase (GGDEF)-like protein/PAS domain S-box-containing protein